MDARAVDARGVRPTLLCALRAMFFIRPICAMVPDTSTEVEPTPRRVGTPAFLLPFFIFFSSALARFFVALACAATAASSC